MRARWFSAGVVTAFALSFGGVVGTLLVAGFALVGFGWLVREYRRFDRMGVLREVGPVPEVALSSRPDLPHDLRELLEADEVDWHALWEQQRADREF